MDINKFYFILKIRRDYLTAVSLIKLLVFELIVRNKKTIYTVLFIDLLF